MDIHLTKQISTTQRIEKGIQRVAYALALVLARFLIRKGHFQGLRSNLAVIHNLPLDSTILEKRVIENLYTAFICYVDFFMVAVRGPDVVDAACEVDPDSLHLIEKYLKQGKGVVLVAPHSTSLDIFMLAMSMRFPEMQALTLAQPRWNTRLMNRLRSKYGMQLTPITSSSLRAAVRRLRNGGIVGIAADVPTPYGAELQLFGRACQLPIGHTRLAMSTNSAIVVGISQRVGPAQYCGFAVDVPRPVGDEEDWAATVLKVLERHIVARPKEWFMPPSLWPEPVGDLLLFQHRLPPALTSRLIQG